MLRKRQEYVGTPLCDLPSFVGGLGLNFFPFNWGWPGVRLRIFTEGIWIGPSFLIFRLIVPVRTFRFDDLAEVQAIGSRFPFKGILFRSRSSAKWAIFGTPYKRREILNILSQFIQNVNVVPSRFNRLNPGSYNT